MFALLISRVDDAPHSQIQKVKYSFKRALQVVVFFLMGLTFFPAVLREKDLNPFLLLACLL